ncbi:Protein SHORT HYPOCOTYL IN WHITE LIGHT 1, partial [Mucuna pruriens]
MARGQVMSFSVTIKSPFLTLNSHFRASPIAFSTHHAYNSSQRFSNLCLSKGRRNFAHDPRTWVRPIVEEDDDENDDDRSLDLLVRFVENVFKKVSKRARKAVRSVLPFPISTHLVGLIDSCTTYLYRKSASAHFLGDKTSLLIQVGFSVNGILMLAFLWILKAFLQVVCTLGSVVFVSILLIRRIWSGVSFLQESRHQKMDELDAWNGAQPVT